MINSFQKSQENQDDHDSSGEMIEQQIELFVRLLMEMDKIIFNFIDLSNDTILSY